jgi:hypothetical protein
VNKYYLKICLFQGLPNLLLEFAKNSEKKLLSKFNTIQINYRTLCKKENDKEGVAWG